MHNEVYKDITIERLQEIERERSQTIADTRFQQWMKQMNVGRLWIDRQLIHNARQAMQDWDITRFNTDKIVVNP